MDLTEDCHLITNGREYIDDDDDDNNNNNIVTPMSTAHIIRKVLGVNCVDLLLRYGLNRRLPLDN